MVLNGTNRHSLLPSEGWETERTTSVDDEHVQRLRAEGLVTDRTPIQIEAKDGTVLEVFEWESKEAIEAAHTNLRVLEMWNEYSAVCDYVPASSVEETSDLFAEFGSMEEAQDV